MKTLLVMFLIYELIVLGFIIYSLGLDDNRSNWQWKHLRYHLSPNRLTLWSWFKRAQAAPILLLLLILAYLVGPRQVNQ